MRWISLIFTALISLALGPLYASDLLNTSIIPLSAATIYTLNDADELQPSGLCQSDDGLYFVSDKHNTLYRLDINQGNATPLPFLKFDKLIPDDPEVNLPLFQRLNGFYKKWTQSGYYDWEGIACGEGEFYLLSEQLRAILKINPSAHSASWLQIDPNIIKQHRLHQHANAGPEGIAFDGQKLYVAFERQPSAIVTVDGQQIYRLRNTLINNMPDDISALTVNEKDLFFINRNHNRLCKQPLNDNEAEHCLSYAAIAQHYLRYPTEYGVVEGAAMNKNELWLITDNNGQTNAWNAQTAPVLVHIEIRDLLNDIE